MSTERTHAITVRNPWAFEIITHRKNVENRDWRPRAAAPLDLYLHAAKKADTSAFYRDMPTAEQISPGRYGAIIGMVTVAGWHDYDSCGGRCSPWAMPFRWHWELRRTNAITPVPCRGELGVWRVPDEVLRSIAERGCG